MQEALDTALAGVPNLPDPGATVKDTVVREVERQGAPGAIHLELLGDLVDLEAERVAGARFAYLKGPLVLLELALVRWSLEVLGFTVRAGRPAGCWCAKRRCMDRFPAGHRAADLPRA